MKQTILRRKIRIDNLISAALAIAVLGPLASGQSDPYNQATSLGGRDIAGPFVLRAIENNSRLQAHQHRYEAARASITAARLLPNPRLQLTHFVEAIQTRTGPQRQAIQLQQPIPPKGVVGQRTSSSRDEAQALWHALSLKQFELVERVASLAITYAFIDRSIAISEKNSQLLARLETLVEDRVRSGGNLGDLIRIQLEAEQLGDRIAGMETEREVAIFDLREAMEIDPSPLLQDLALSVPGFLGPEVEQWRDSVTRRSPQLAMLRALESSQSARARLATFANRPEFAVGINYIRTGDALDPSLPQSGRDPWAVMLAVSLPIWKKSNSAAELAASLEAEAISSETRALEQALLSKCDAAIAKLRDGQERISRYDERLIPLAEQSLEITESSYLSGNASALDLIDSEQALLKLETEYWQAVADVWRARWLLAALSGGVWLD